MSERTAQRQESLLGARPYGTLEELAAALARVLTSRRSAVRPVGRFRSALRTPMMATALLYKRAPAQNLRELAKRVARIRRCLGATKFAAPGRIPVGPAVKGAEPDGRLSFHFTDCEGLDHQMELEGGRLWLRREKQRDSTTIYSSWEAYTAFFANRRSAQLLFLDGDWAFRHGRTGFFDFQDVAPMLLAVEDRLPNSWGDTGPVRALVKKASLRLGDISTVERISEPTTNEFLVRYAHRGKPFIAVDSTATWPKVHWSFDDLLDAYEGQLTYLSEYPPLVFPISDFLHRLRRGDPVGLKVALPLVRGIRNNYRHPKYFDADTFFERGQALIVAPSNSSAPVGYHATCWHRDWADNFLVQLIGRKRVYLAPPTDEECFYLQCAPPQRGNLAVDFSPITTRHPDLARYPAFRGARIVECVLEPGDTLYLPCGWLHHVENLSPSCGINCWRMRPLCEVAVQPGAA